MISIDTASEALAYMIADKTKQLNATEDSNLKMIIQKELKMLKWDREVLYGESSNDDFNYILSKITDKYCPIIKNAITTRTSIGNLL
jgi:hypothetical protein